MNEIKSKRNTKKALNAGYVSFEFRHFYFMILGFLVFQLIRTKSRLFGDGSGFRLVIRIINCASMLM